MQRDRLLPLACEGAALCSGCATAFSASLKPVASPWEASASRAKAASPIAVIASSPTLHCALAGPEPPACRSSPELPRRARARNPRSGQRPRARRRAQNRSGRRCRSSRSRHWRAGRHSRRSPRRSSGLCCAGSAASQDEAGGRRSGVSARCAGRRDRRPAGGVEQPGNSSSCCRCLNSIQPAVAEPMKPGAGAQRQFQQRDVERGTPDMRDGGRRAGAGGDAGPLHAPFAEQPVDAETSRVHAELDQQRDGLRRHAFDPRRMMRKRPFAGVDLDIEAELPPADRRQQADGSASEHDQRSLARRIGAQATTRPGGSIGTNRASAGVLKTTRKFWRATASALATMPPVPTIALRAALISLEPRKRPFL